MASREHLKTMHAARKGDGPSQLRLGRLYLFGDAGFAKNIVTALHWLDRAAQQEISEAWILIGRHIPYDISGRTTDASRLLIWYEKALDAGVAQAGLPLAQIILAQAGCTSPALRHKAIDALQQAAHAGNADAQWLLAQQALPPAIHPADTGHLGKEQINVPPTTVLALAASAANSGVLAARYALAEHAWQKGDYTNFLHWSLPIARELVGHC